MCACMKLVRFTYTERDVGGQLSGCPEAESQLTQPQAYTSQGADSLVPYLHDMSQELTRRDPLDHMLLCPNR